jgi:hypothetical protein
MCDYCENSKLMIRKEYPSATSFGWRDDETKFNKLQNVIIILVYIVKIFISNIVMI